MKKRSIAMMIASVLLCCICFSVICSASQDELVAEDIRLFDRDGDYISKNPNSGEDAEDWYTILGKDNYSMEQKDNFITSEKGVYPLDINNRSDKPAVYYYLAGSNNIDEVLVKHPEYLDYLEKDFVIEYDVKYTSLDESRLSIVNSFNYLYYIDVYIDPDGTGDIAAVSNGNQTTSLLSSDSILDPEDSSELLSKLYGEGKSNITGGYVNVAVRVSVNENKMPKAITVYINGLKAAEADTDALSAFVDEYTPVYEIKAGERFPSDALGNIVAIKCVSGTKCQLDNIRIYHIEETVTEPEDEAVEKYASIYGNLSYNSGEASTETNTAENVTEENVENLTEEETGEGVTESSSEDVTQAPNTGDDSGPINTVVLVILIIILVLAIAALVVAAIVIIKKRK